MIRGLYTSATGMGIEQLKQDTISNNLANTSTVGFKRDSTVIQSFPDLLIARMGKEKDKKDIQVIGSTNLGAIVGDIITNFKDGILEETQNPLNIALTGEGFFVVDTPKGERFTRDGNFTLNSEGYLVTQDGYRVNGENGHVLVHGELTINSKGEIFIDENKVNLLKVRAFQNPNTLRKAGQNLYELGAKSEIKQADFSVHQGYLEKPNINMVDEMVELMAIVRAYETNQKLIQAQDDILGKSVNEVGRIR